MPEQTLTITLRGTRASLDELQALTTDLISGDTDPHDIARAHLLRCETPHRTFRRWVDLPVSAAQALVADLLYYGDADGGWDYGAHHRFRTFQRWARQVEEQLDALTPRPVVRWDIGDEDHATARSIAERAHGALSEHEDMSVSGRDPGLWHMDVVATHLNGCPLRLTALLHAPLFDFLHDMLGIHKHLDRTTGKLTGCFLPRYAAPEGPTDA